MHRQHTHHDITSTSTPTISSTSTPTISSTRPRVEISLLGAFGVVVDGITSPAAGWARRSASALIKILALSPGHRLHRETVMDLLWPDEAPGRCAPRLHKAAHFARRAAGHPDAIVLRDDVVWLFPDSDMLVDAIEFERLARDAVTHQDPAAARIALTWYGGELLPADRYELWAIDRRELLHLRRLEILRVANEWRELVEIDPSDEEANERIMREQIVAGDRAAAVRQYRHLARVLDRDLGLTPGPAARAACSDACEGDTCADRPGAAGPVDALLAELAHLVSRQKAVLAELVAVGVAPATLARSARR